MQESVEIMCQFIVTRGETAKLFKLIEKSLERVSCL
jgi:hypothetical protein